MTVGIIGQGSFGTFIAGVLRRQGASVMVHDKARRAKDSVSLETVAKVEVLILAVPLSSYDELLAKLRPLLGAETLVVDICSVKTEARKRLLKGLPGHKNMLITHPMFGPQSAAAGTAGHVLVVTGVMGEKAKRALRFFETELGLKVMRMTDEAHDRAMADVHALTFFVARGLGRSQLAASPFQAPSFQMLLDLVAFDQTHSDDLFKTVELGNPFAAEARQRLLTVLKAVDDQLRKETL